VPHEILRVFFNTILYENEFQKASNFPEHKTPFHGTFFFFLAIVRFGYWIGIMANGDIPLSRTSSTKSGAGCFLGSGPAVGRGKITKSNFLLLYPYILRHWKDIYKAI
jgi:hypothetical protein